MAAPAQQDPHGTVAIGGRPVRRIGYGAMRLTGDGIWGPPADRPAAVALLREAVDLGVQLIDTADAYGPEVNEELIAEALHPYPDHLVIATKGGATRPSRGSWRKDGRPAHLREACDASLRRLRLEQIPLYQLHGPDPDVPFEETVGALGELQAAGKVGAVGLSNVSEDLLRTARAHVDVASVQNPYNLTDRSSQDVLDRCTEDGIPFIAYVPLIGGSVDEATTSALAGIAERRDLTAAQVALAWLLHVSPVTVPIPGTTSSQHLREDVAAAAIELTEDEVAALADAA